MRKNLRAAVLAILASTTLGALAAAPAHAQSARGVRASQHLDGLDFTVTDILARSDAVVVRFSVRNSSPQTKPLYVIADGRYGATRGSRLFAMNQMFQFQDVELGGQANRRSPFAYVTIPAGIALDGELRLSGVAIPSEIKLVEIVASTRSRHGHDTLQFRP